MSLEDVGETVPAFVFEPFADFAVNKVNVADFIAMKSGRNKTVFLIQKEMDCLQFFSRHGGIGGSPFIRSREILSFLIQRIPYIAILLRPHPFPALPLFRLRGSGEDALEVVVGEVVNENAVLPEPEADAGEELFEPAGAFGAEVGIVHPFPDDGFEVAGGKVARVEVVFSGPGVDFVAVFAVDVLDGDAVGFAEIGEEFLGGLAALSGRAVSAPQTAAGCGCPPAPILSIREGFLTGGKSNMRKTAQGRMFATAKIVFIPGLYDPGALTVGSLLDRFLSFRRFAGKIRHFPAALHGLSEKQIF